MEFSRIPQKLDADEAGDHIAAQDRQILLFTCQSRESALMANREGVNLISL